MQIVGTMRAQNSDQPASPKQTGEEIGGDKIIEIVAEAGLPTITLRRAFDAPRQLVFEAWTNEEQVKRWYKPHGFTLSDCKIDFRIGGKWRLLLQAPDGQDHGVTGEYREIAASERLVQVFHYDGALDAEAIETLTFVEEDEQTILTIMVVHKSVEDRDRSVKFGGEKAAHQLLGRLDDHLRASAGRASDPSVGEQITIPEQRGSAPDGFARGRKWDRRLGAGALAGLLLLSGAFYWLWPRGAAAHYVTEPVDRGPVTRKVSARGVVLAVPSTPVKPSIAGQVQSVYCGLGAKVQAGQLCAKIEPLAFKAAVARETAALKAAEARLKKARSQLERVSGRHRRRAGPAYEQAQARVTAAEAAIARTQASLNTAELGLFRTEIVSPVNGTVISRNIEPGQTLRASGETPLFVISPESATARIEAKLAPEEAEEIKAGDEASFTADDPRDRTFSGSVKQISLMLQTSEDARHSDVVIDASDANLSLKPGMTGIVEFIKDRPDDTLRVPDRSLQYASSRQRAAPQGSREIPPGWTRLWVLRNGSPSPVDVRLGASDGAYTEVLEGDLRPGDQLIVG